MPLKRFLRFREEKEAHIHLPLVCMTYPNRTSTVPVPYQYRAITVPLPCFYDIFIEPLPHYRIIIIQLPYHYRSIYLPLRSWRQHLSREWRGRARLSAGWIRPCPFPSATSRNSTIVSINETKISIYWHETSKSTTQLSHWFMRYWHIPLVALNCQPINTNGNTFSTKTTARFQHKCNTAPIQTSARFQRKRNTSPIQTKKHYYINTPGPHQQLLPIKLFFYQVKQACCLPQATVWIPV